MTSNRERAAEVIQKKLGCMTLSAEDTARRLADAGLLAEDLPEPDWTGDLNTWETTHGDIEILAGGMIDTPVAYMTTPEAREFALALLAAAEHAETEVTDG